MRLAMIALALVLAGCEARLRFGTGEILQIPAQDKVIEKDGETVIEPSPPEVLCQARARHFRGTVSVPCEEIARQIAP